MVADGGGDVNGRAMIITVRSGPDCLDSSHLQLRLVYFGM